MEKETIKEELKKLKALQSVAHLEGVQQLVAHAKSTVVTCVEILSSQYVEKHESELRSLCATLKANLELYQLMSGVDDQVKAIEKAME